MVKRKRVTVDQRDRNTIAYGAGSTMVVGVYQSPETSKHCRPIFPDLDYFLS